MIKISGSWYLDADSCNFMVGEKYTANEKDGDGNPVKVERLRNVKYYATISDALIGSVKYKLRTAIERQEVNDIFELRELFLTYNNEIISDFERIEKQVEEYKVVTHDTDAIKKSRKAIGASF